VVGASEAIFAGFAGIHFQHRNNLSIFGQKESICVDTEYVVVKANKTHLRKRVSYINDQNGTTVYA
jgi:hypothetical protein